MSMPGGSGCRWSSVDPTDPLQCRITTTLPVRGHVDYTIEVRRGYCESNDRQKLWTVRRRYRDFAKLNLKLESIGLELNLPPKKLFGNTHPDFVAVRSEGLQAFLDNICTHPILYASQAVSQFLELLPSDALSQSIECMSVSLRNLRGWSVQEDWLDSGWRATKQFYLVKPTEGRKTRRDILSWTSYGPDWSLTPETTRELLDFLAKLECPYIQQPLFSWCGELGALTVRRLLPEGTLRDHFYKSKPCDSYMKKYNFNCEVFTLQIEDVRHIGRHILEALRFLNSVGIPYGQLHCGNLIITESGCQLLDVEEGILGLPSMFRPIMVSSKFVKTVEDMEVFCFGQTIYEMVTGWAWFPDQAVDRALQQCPIPFRVLLQSIFAPEATNLPSINDLLQNELFADIPVAKLTKNEVRMPAKLRQHLCECRSQIERRLHRDQAELRRSMKLMKVRSFVNSDEQRSKRRQLIKEWSQEVRGRFQTSNSPAETTDTSPIAPVPLP